MCHAIFCVTLMPSEALFGVLGYVRVTQIAPRPLISPAVGLALRSHSRVLASRAFRLNAIFATMPGAVGSKDSPGHSIEALVTPVLVSY